MCSAYCKCNTFFFFFLLSNIVLNTFFNSWFQVFSSGARQRNNTDSEHGIQCNFLKILTRFDHFRPIFRGNGLFQMTKENSLGVLLFLPGFSPISLFPFERDVPTDGRDICLELRLIPITDGTSSYGSSATRSVLGADCIEQDLGHWKKDQRVLTSETCLHSFSDTV